MQQKLLKALIGIAIMIFTAASIANRPSLHILFHITIAFCFLNYSLLLAHLSDLPVMAILTTIPSVLTYVPSCFFILVSSAFVQMAVPVLIVVHANQTTNVPPIMYILLLSIPILSLHT